MGAEKHVRQELVLEWLEELVLVHLVTLLDIPIHRLQQPIEQSKSL